MLIDLSHCGPKVVADVLELSEKPVTIGHTCSKVLADNPRNKTDEQMKRLKRKRRSYRDDPVVAYLLETQRKYSTYY